jgi:hypothetical protein
MRKVFWCGAAASVCLAAVVYLAADYASSHSDTLFGRCASAGYHVATKYNPFYRLGEAAGNGFLHLAKGAVAPMMAACDSLRGGEEQCECPGCPGAAGGHCPKCRKGKCECADCPKGCGKGDGCAKDKPAPEVPAPQPDVPAHTLGKIVIQEQEEARIEIEKPMPPVQGIGDAEVPQFMPFVDDQPPVPATMPRVEESSSFKPERFSPVPAARWLNPQPADKEEAVPAEMPKVEPPTEEPPMDEPIPYHENAHSNCCPYTGKCPDDEEAVPFQPKVTEPAKAEPPKATEPATSPEPESKPKTEKSDKSEKGKKKCDKVGEGCPGDARPHFDCVPY